MSGTVAIEEVFAGTTAEPLREAPRAASGGGLDPEAMRRLLRRDEQRRERLKAD